jgi:hypothetical protein
MDSWTLRCEENLEGSNMYQQSQQSNRPFRRNINKLPPKPHAEVTMRAVEAPVPMTPLKTEDDQQDEYSSSSEVDYKWKVSTSKKQSFKNILKRPGPSQGIRSALKRTTSNKDDQLFKLVPNRNPATMSACKALLKKSKVELVGMLFNTGMYSLAS